MGIQQAAVLWHGFRQKLIKLKNSLSEDIHTNRQYDAHRYKFRIRTGRTRNYKKTLNSTSKEFLYGVKFHEDQNLPEYNAVSVRNLLPTFRRGFVASNFIVHITFEYLSKRMRGYSQAY